MAWILSARHSISSEEAYRQLSLYLGSLLLSDRRKSSGTGPSARSVADVRGSAGDESALDSSQPLLDLVPVKATEIDAWFAAQGFERIADAAYYRAEGNLGALDAHDRNVVRPGDMRDAGAG